jgi:hypothetical protein
MQLHVRLVLAASFAALLLALAAGSAGARRFEVSERGFVMEFPEFGYSGGGVNVICSATLVGSFHSRTISKVSGSLIGYITEAGIAHPCRQGEAWLLNGREAPEGVTSANTLPWHVRYTSFSGTLPRIAKINITIEGYAFLEMAIGISCLYRSTTARPALFEVELSSEGRITSISWEAGDRVPLFSGSGLCPAESVFSGTGTFTTRARTAIFVRLVQ